MPSNHVTKKQLILEIAGRHRFKSAGERELRAIQQEMTQLAGGQAAALSYIARVLQESGVTLRFAPFGPVLEEPYASRLKGLLRFGNFEEAEHSLRELDAVYREYRSGGDRKGAELIRAAVLRGRRRAEALAANSRLALTKRTEKREIARWFGVWLQTPLIFFDWLDLRKQSEEFRNQLGS